MASVLPSGDHVELIGGWSCPSRAGLNAAPGLTEKISEWLGICGRLRCSRSRDLRHLHGGERARWGCCGLPRRGYRGGDRGNRDRPVSGRWWLRRRAPVHRPEDEHQGCCAPNDQTIRGVIAPHSRPLDPLALDRPLFEVYERRLTRQPFWFRRWGACSPRRRCSCPAERSRSGLRCT
jgi:hypothetical protein